MIPVKKEDLWSTNNQARTHSIFLETAKPGETPVLTLEAEDSELVCLKTLYMSYAVTDPTEVLFAETVFADLKYWKRLKEAKFFQAYLNEWRELAEEKRKQIAFNAIIQEIESKSRNSFAAAKYLIEEPWKPKTKESKARSQKTTEKALTPFQEDVERLKDLGFLQ